MIFSRVPTTAYSKIVPILLKNALLGMKNPASRTIGGNRYRKNRSKNEKLQQKILSVDLTWMKIQIQAKYLINDVSGS